jgi:hypothetical protein
MIAGILAFWPGVAWHLAASPGPRDGSRGEVMAVHEFTTTQAPEAPRDWWVPIDWP